jgi:hypothetical protein
MRLSAKPSSPLSAYMFGLAYLASFVTYHVAVALGGGVVGG